MPLWEQTAGIRYKKKYTDKIHTIKLVLSLLLKPLRALYCARNTLVVLAYRPLASIVTTDHRDNAMDAEALVLGACCMCQPHREVVLLGLYVVSSAIKRF